MRIPKMYFTRFAYGWEFWLGSLKVAWIKPCAWIFDHEGALFYCRLGHVEISNDS